jgi:flagellar protein FliO/FliZ
MDALFGSTMPMAVKFFIAFAVVLALIGVTAWLVRRFGTSRLGGTARGRQPRLAVIDAASVDGRRRLVLIRRDNTEHLLMIGGPTDVVIEPNIVRAANAREATRETSARLEPAWQAQVSEPAPPPPPPPVTPTRGYRAPATEEPWLPPEPGARARPADSLTGMAADFSAKLNPPEPASPPHTVAPPVAPPPSPQNDHNLAEMAQQLEAALRRPPAQEARPPVTDALAVPAAPKQAAPARDFKPRMEPKFEPKREAKFEPPPAAGERRPQPKFDPKFEPKFEPAPAIKPESRLDAQAAPGKSQYDNLEEEMASLLGRPTDKS